MQSDNAGTVHKITVLYEDSDVVVITKPVGIMVHEDGHTPSHETVVGWFLGRTPEAKGVGESTYTPQGMLFERSGVVHRLDRDTSGVMILAKTAFAHQHLKAQFRERAVKKEYRAFVYGRMKERFGTINRPIGRSPRDFRLRSAQKGSTGTLRDALTLWECLGSGEYVGEVFSYLRLQPKTGRTHQLRVHLKAIDRPIVGDTLYATHLLETSNNLAFNRLALHAHILEITLPSGEYERFLAPVPHDFEVAAERIAE